MNIMKKFKDKAKNNKKTIVLPEGLEPRIYKAAEKVANQDLAELFLLGAKKDIIKKAKKDKVSLKGVKIINPEKADYINEFAEKYYEIRKHKNITIKEAKEQMKDPLYFGAMLVNTGKADGMVAGAVNATGNVLSPAFKIIKTKPGISVVSGAFIMNVPNCCYGNNGVMIFSDCAVNPNPTAEQLSEIAISSAQTAENMLDMDPAVAMLSFSTKGSACHELVDKVVKATEIANKKAPEIMLDGELQADASLIPEVAKTKSPESKVAGKANVLIFPDLQSGNIGYKLVQRLAGAEAIGPILQGIARPVNDLSRGCSVEDVVNVTAITAVQSQVDEDQLN